MNCQPRQSANNGTLQAFFLLVTFLNLGDSLPPGKNDKWHSVMGHSELDHQRECYMLSYDNCQSTYVGSSFKYVNIFTLDGP